MLKYLSLMIVLLTISLQVVLGATDKESSSDIVVCLDTKSTLKPIYLISEININHTLDRQYQKNIDEILTFDFQNNGFTQITNRNIDKEKLSQQESLQNTSLANDWKKNGIRYVLKINLEQQNLTAKILDCHKKIITVFDPMALTGNISEDRRRLHKLHDNIHQSISGDFGIASKKIVYSKRIRKNPQHSNKWVSEVWECDYDGHNNRQVTNLNGYIISPSYIPAARGYQSNEIMYISYETGQPKIFSSSLRNSHTNRISYLRGNQLMPTISLQRDKIAFISDVTGNPDLFLQSFNPEIGTIGKPKQIFAPIRGTQASPTFGPNGNRIAFVSNKDGSPKIYILDISNTSPERLKKIKPILISRQNHQNTDPSWSSDGKKIAYSSLTNGTRQIWIYDLETSKEEQITKGPGHKENPAWAADSLHLIFNSATPFSSELYIINLNQKQALQISAGEGEKRFPAWEL